MAGFRIVPPYNARAHVARSAEVAATSPAEPAAVTTDVNGTIRPAASASGIGGADRSALL